MTRSRVRGNLEKECAIDPTIMGALKTTNAVENRCACEKGGLSQLKTRGAGLLRRGGGLQAEGGGDCTDTSGNKNCKGGGRGGKRKLHKTTTTAVQQGDVTYRNGRGSSQAIASANGKGNFRIGAGN